MPIVVAGSLVIFAGLLASRAERAHAVAARLLADVAERQTIALQMERRATEALERLSGMSVAAARRAVEQRAVDLSAAYTAHVLATAQREATAQATARASWILAGAVAGVASTPDRISYRSSVRLPDTPGLRARLVGREGRNLAAFTEVTGVQLALRDGRPFAVLTAFDPERRAIAEETLSRLLGEPKIYESTIKQTYDSVSQDWPSRLAALGREAAGSAGAGDLNDELAVLMGRLHFRRINGVTALGHAVSGARIAAVLAAEIGWPHPRDVVRAAFLRDLGYAVRAATGHHAEVGAAVAAQHGEPDIVCRAIRQHHALPTLHDDVVASIVACAERIALAGTDAPHEPPKLALTRLREVETELEALDGVQSARVLGLADEVSVWVDAHTVPDHALPGLTLHAAELVRRRIAMPVTMMVHRHTAMRLAPDGEPEPLEWPGPAGPPASSGS